MPLIQRGTSRVQKKRRAQGGPAAVIEVWQRVSETLAEEFDCPHTETEVRYREGAGGRRFFQQCRECGSLVCAVRRADLDLRVISLALSVDEERAGEWKSAKAERRAELYRATRDERSTEWWARYEEYLKSPEWEGRRAKVLARCGGTCEACGERPATQAHHLTYERVFEEPLFDLAGVCQPCHWKLHG
jgi:hypothetical protein